MRSIPKEIARYLLRCFGLRLIRTKRDPTLVSDVDYTKIRNDLIESLINFNLPSDEDTLHKHVSSKVIESYNSTKGTPHDPVYGASQLWIDVYKSSPYLGSKAVISEKEVGEALFYGCRCGWLEGSGPSFLLKSWLFRDETFDENITTLIKGRTFLRSLWSELDQHLELLNEVFYVGQPLVIELKEDVISDCDLYWFYLTRIMQFLKRNRQERFVCLDLGSGYGRFAWVLKKFIPNSTIVCCDIPETLLGASYRLSVYFPEARHWYFNSSASGTELRNLADYDFIYLPGFAMEHLPENSLDLVVNTMSLSEMQMETVLRYIFLIEKCLKWKEGIFYTVNRSVPKQNRMHVDIPLGKFPICERAFRKLRYTDRFKEVDNFFRASVQSGEAVFRRR